MQRRKFLVGMGSLAAGSAATIGTGAFATARVDRAINVDVAGDNAAYLGLDASISEYAVQKNKKLQLVFDGSNGQNGDGLNPDSDTAFHNVFRIQNNGTNKIRVTLQDVPSDSPMVFKYTDGADNSTTLTDQTYFPNSPKPLADTTYGPSGSQNSGHLELGVGDDAYVHISFYLRDEGDAVDDVTTDASAIPEEFGIYASGLIDDDGL
ncbi:hypothetical protein [Natrinema sp. 1APR25-10V2]|uniref:hypothetical protein n=1 Tax=Natrinema sp. 1APR25-10V2 TaxID=2951081 RepID=UPI002876718F|nr:hypothetical protein [Natrinema sp. 1APR25-10V2]MDS0473659.1 hypothetical protein [Natrinema sp. 1APR25-10V2]